MFYKIINRKKRVATRVADLLGYSIWAPVNLLARKPLNPREIKEILVIRTAYIGDVVMTMPVLKPLKELYPESRITFLTCGGARELLKGNPYVDAVLSHDVFWFYPGSKGFAEFLKELRSKRYDLVIEARADVRDIMFLAYAAKARYRLSYNVGGGGFLLTHTAPYPGVKHKVEYHLDLVRHLGAKIDFIEWGLVPAKEELLKADGLLGGGGLTALKIGIHPGGRKALKSWAPERFASLADRLITELGASVYFSGSPDEKELIDGIQKKMRNKAVNLAGKGGLRVGMAVIKRLDLFITNDSAPLHLASAMKTPTVAIFGPSKSIETGPYGNLNRVVEKDYPCRYTCDEDVCNFRNFNECMDSITVDDVFNAASRVIGEIEADKVCQ
ncbi:MAG: glycosyltransferase family 9 protein [Deltaproteobacteria bacterium]|nr:glycosyltransferase family 9 protein [Deltaproteobacteria bacterium]